MTFDRPIESAGKATITEGKASITAMSIKGNDVVINCNVADQQYVTFSVTNVGGTGGSGLVRVGFLAGDANQSRSVTLTDLLQVNTELSNPATAGNFLKDVNATGVVTLTDKVLVNSKLTNFLPKP